MPSLQVSVRYSCSIPVVSWSNCSMLTLLSTSCIMRELEIIRINFIQFVDILTGDINSCLLPDPQALSISVQQRRERIPEHLQVEQRSSYHTSASPISEPTLPVGTMGYALANFVQKCHMLSVFAALVKPHMDVFKLILSESLCQSAQVLVMCNE